jgi:hypothetical protein
MKYVSVVTVIPGTENPCQKKICNLANFMQLTRGQTRRAWGSYAVAVQTNSDHCDIFYIHSSYTVLLRCRGFSFFFDLYTIGRTPLTSDRPVARPLPKYRTTHTQNKTRAHTPTHQTSMP